MVESMASKKMKLKLKFQISSKPADQEFQIEKTLPTSQKMKSMSKAVRFVV